MFAEVFGSKTQRKSNFQTIFKFWGNLQKKIGKMFHKFELGEWFTYMKLLVTILFTYNLKKFNCL